MAPLRIACVGHASVDHVFQIRAFPVTPTKTPAHGYQGVSGGMAANAALAAARLGAQVRFVGAVGDDLAAGLVRRQLGAEGIDLHHLQTISGAHTSTSAIVVDATGERQIFNHLGNALAQARLPDEAVFEGCAAVLVDPRWPAGARAALAWARRNERLSVLDADVAPQADLAMLVPLARWVAFSEPGLAVWAGPLPHTDALRRALDHGCEHALVTLGERGVLHASAAGITTLPAFAIEAVDTTGAGDVFHGALTLALAQGTAVQQALVYASAAAALKCTRSGGSHGAPDAAQVAAFLQQHCGASAGER